MSKRNMIWLAVVVAVGVALGIAVSVWWGVIGAAVVLVVSEVVERGRRARKRAERGDEAVSPLRGAIATRRKSR